MAALTTNVSGVNALGLLLSTATTQLFFTGAVDGQTLILTLQQDGTGGRLVTSGNVTAIEQPASGANARTMYELGYDAVNNVWNVLSPALALPGGVSTPTTYITAGAIPVAEGLSLIGGSGVTAVTLAAPTSGGPGVGNDGQVMTFTCTTAHAHTLTTPANKINGGYDTVTFAAIADSISLQAFGGVWYVVGAHGTATLSEV